jgi:hypothetical protein
VPSYSRVWLEHSLWQLRLIGSNPESPSPRDCNSRLGAHAWVGSQGIFLVPEVQDSSKRGAKQPALKTDKGD